jgi:CheY-like chemotaxis protein
VTLKKPYLVLVEDDADDRFMMQQAFQDVHFVDHVQFFSSSDIFLTHISQISKEANLPSLIVLDFNMPVINGGELLLKLKKNERLQHIPVVLYSTGMRSILKETLLASGATECFEKGMEYHELLRLAKTLRLMAEGGTVVY